MSTTYLVSGTTRGIGRGLVSALLLRPNTLVFAGVRDPSAKGTLHLNSRLTFSLLQSLTPCPAAQDLLSLPKAPDSSVFLVKLDSSSESDAAQAIQTLQQEHNITHLDVVIANAGILTTAAPCREVTLDSLRSHFEINTLGPIILFQACLSLLQKSPDPKFVLTTSAVASCTIAPSLPAPVVAYAVSKVAANWFVSRAQGEHPEICFLPIHPGLVVTDMSSSFMEHAAEPGSGDDFLRAISVEECVKGYLQVVDKATKEKDGGKFLQWDGEVLPW